MNNFIMYSDYVNVILQNTFTCSCLVASIYSYLFQSFGSKNVYSLICLSILLYFILHEYFLELANFPSVRIFAPGHGPNGTAHGPLQRRAAGPYMVRRACA